MLTDNIIQAIVLSMAVAAVSMTVTRAAIFSWLRDLTDNVSTFLGDLFSCPYCFSHWVSATVTVIYQPRLVNSSFVVVDLIVALFAMVTMSSLFCGLIAWAFNHDNEES